MSERDLFIAALQISPPAARAVWLDRECGGDAALRQRIDVLLAAFDKAGSLLENPAAAAGATIDQPSLQGPASVIGPYKLLEQIGEGGFGVVFMAEQSEPVRRKVALKILKPGMDTRQVVARFEAERQALAIMDHPNIAKVFDGGATASGRPYFVMELVKGVPITEFCDQNQLTPRQRLELFVPVCQAVQHAHQKGIIHRDLKPSNVLVSRHDTTPIVKVIDFGVAKALGQELTDKTLFTGIAQMVGTPLYMSPEQAGMSDLDVDTRSDIYSLGVLLYELLTGTTPFTKERFKQAAYDEIRRIIREEEPPRPSTRLSDLGRSGDQVGRFSKPSHKADQVGRFSKPSHKAESAEDVGRFSKPSHKAEPTSSIASISAQRQTEPAKLRKLVRGELDWIVMKALDKDRNRRYETANGLAHDIEHYLHDEPVTACPPSVSYRLRKLVRRHRAVVLAASLILLCLLAGIIGTSAGLLWALEERDEKARALSAETKEREGKEKALAAETKARLAEKNARETALSALRAMTDDIIENQMGRGTQLGNENKEFLRKIIKHFEGFAAVTADDAESLAIRAEGYGNVALLRHKLGELKDAETAFDAELDLRKRLVAAFPARAKSRENLARGHIRRGNLFLATGRLPQAEACFREALDIQKQLAAEFPSRPELRHGRAMGLHNLGLVLGRTGGKGADAALDESLAILKELVAAFPKKLEFRHSLAYAYNSLGRRLSASGRLREALTAYTAAHDFFKRSTAEFPARADFRQQLAESHQNLGVALRDMGRPEDAEKAHGDALAVLKQLAADFPSRPEFRDTLASAQLWLGQLLRDMRRLKEAEQAYDDALLLQKRLAADFPLVPEYRQRLAKTQSDLALLLRYAGRPKEAEKAYAAALVLQKKLTDDFPMRPDFRQDLARTYNDLGFLLFTTRRLREADKSFAAALDLRQQAVAESPGQSEVHNDLAGTCVNLAILHIEQRDFKAAKAYLDQAMPHHDAALKAKPRHPIYRQFYRNHLVMLTQANAGLGDKARAQQTAQTVCDLGWDSPGDAYDAACYLSLCIPIVRRDDKATKEARDQQAAFYGDEAMKMLRKAVARGWRNAVHMKMDTDLAPLRDREDFQKLLAELQAGKQEKK